MSAVLGGGVGGSGGGGETAPAGALLEPDVEGIIEEKNQLISRQYAEIERLQRELAEVVGERDALLCEVSKFKFEREMTDLKRLHDDRYSGGTDAWHVNLGHSNRVRALQDDRLISTYKDTYPSLSLPRSFLMQSTSNARNRAASVSTARGALDRQPHSEGTCATTVFPGVENLYDVHGEKENGFVKESKNVGV